MIVENILTLLSAQQPLNTFDKLVSVSVGVNADFLQLFVTHVNQHIQGDLELFLDRSQISLSHQPEECCAFVPLCH